MSEWARENVPLLTALLSVVALARSSSAPSAA